MSPWHVVLVALAGWLNREQQKIVEYLKEETAVKGKELGIKVLRELGCIVTPDTILRWY